MEGNALKKSYCSIVTGLVLFTYLLGFRYKIFGFVVVVVNIKTCTCGCRYKIIHLFQSNYPSSSGPPPPPGGGGPFGYAAASSGPPPPPQGQYGGGYGGGYGGYQQQQSAYNVNSYQQQGKILFNSLTAHCDFAQKENSLKSWIIIETLSHCYI